MAKRVKDSRDMAQASCFELADLPPAVDAALLTAPDAPEPAPVTEAEDEEVLLRRVQVSPAALSRAVVVLSALATEHGLSAEECEHVTLFLRERDILVATDLDRNATTTVDGRARPFRARWSVPLLEGVNEGRALWAGARFRARDLLVSLRNRVENSDDYGVLGEDKAARLELYLSPKTQQPSRFVVTPMKGEVAETPRQCVAVRGAPLTEFERPEPEVGTQPLSDLDADALVEIAAAAHPAVGILLEPRMTPGAGANGAPLPAYLAAAGPRGVVVSAFPSPLTAPAPTAPEAAPAQIALDVAPDAPATAPEAALEAAPEAERALREPVVLSPRFAEALGVAQDIMADAAKEQQRALTARHEALIAVAATAAALDLAGPVAVDAVYESVGAKAAAKAQGGKRAATPTAAALQFARLALAQVPAAEQATFADALRDAVRDLPAPAADAIDVLRAESHGDALVAQVATAWVAGQADAPRFARVATIASGAAQVRLVARANVAGDDEARAVEQLRFADIATAAVQLKGRQAAEVIAAALPYVPADEVGAWWERFTAHLAEANVPAEAIAAMRKLRGPEGASALPAPAALRVPSRLREEWLRRCQRAQRGLLWQAADGRVAAGFDGGPAGRLEVSDLAVNPAVQDYPLSHDVVRGALLGEGHAWRAEVAGEDLLATAKRVVGLAPLRRPSAEAEAQTVFLARWTPATSDQTADGGVVAALGRPNLRVPTEPNRVRIGEGPAAQEFLVERPGSPTPADPADVGELRVFGLDRAGEYLHARLPMIAVEGAAGAPVAFALDAQGLQHLVHFVAAADDVVVVDAAADHVRLAAGGTKRLAVVPTVTQAGITPAFHAVLAAAGVQDHGAAVPIASVSARVRQLAGARIARTASPVEPPTAAAMKLRPAAVPQPDAAPGLVVEADLLSVAAARALVAEHAGSVEAAVQHLNASVRQTEARVAQLMQVRDGLTALETSDLFDNVERTAKSSTRDYKRHQKAIERLRQQLAEWRAMKRHLVTLSSAPAVPGALRGGLDRLHLAIDLADDAATEGTVAEAVTAAAAPAAPAASAAAAARQPAAPVPTPLRVGARRS